MVRANVQFFVTRILWICLTPLLYMDELYYFVPHLLTPSHFLKINPHASTRHEKQ